MTRQYLNLLLGIKKASDTCGVKNKRNTSFLDSFSTVQSFKNYTHELSNFVLTVILFYPLFKEFFRILNFF